MSLIVLPLKVAGQENEELGAESGLPVSGTVSDSGGSAAFALKSWHSLCPWLLISACHSWQYGGCPYLRSPGGFFFFTSVVSSAVA